MVKFSIYLNWNVFVMSRFPADRSKVVPLLQLFFVCASVVSLFVPHLSFFCCLGRAVLRVCGFSRVSFLVFSNPLERVRYYDNTDRRVSIDFFCFCFL